MSLISKLENEVAKAMSVFLGRQITKNVVAAFNNNRARQTVIPFSSLTRVITCSHIA